MKAWRYVGVFGPELMLCVGQVRIARARQTFWAVWDRANQRLYERTVIGHGGLTLATGYAHFADKDIAFELHFDETPGIEAICPAGRSYAWTRKQGGVRATGTITIGHTRHAIDARALVDDTAAYYPRHTSWQWSAGVGLAEDGRELAWNLVSGVNDPLRDSERTVWVVSEPREASPSAFAEDLSSVDQLLFNAEAERARRDNLLLVRSSYRQPFGTFRGELPGGITLAEGYGVMEQHQAWW